MPNGSYCSKMNGFFTVEASILMPFVIILYFTFIFFTEYAYNKALLMTDTGYILALAHETAVNDSENLNKKLNEAFTIIKKDRPYRRVSDFTISYSINKNLLTINSKLRFSTPIKAYSGIWFDTYEGKIEISKSVNITDPVDVMKIIREYNDIRKDKSDDKQ